ncbi:MAG: ATP-binding cassette domain-containing protein [Sporolactobacillus sp.]
MSFALDNISYKYSPDADYVLTKVSFTVKPKQITAIVGRSGCGKSTLVNVLSGVIPELMTKGVLEGQLKVEENALVSVVSQTPENQLFGYGVEDALAFGVENMGLSSQEVHERVDYVLDLLQIHHLRKRAVATLSGGQRQVVCIASVLAMRPDVVIMDEPVSSLDPQGKAMVQSVLNRLRTTGQTTVIVDNNLDWSSEIVDHIIGLDQGQIVFDGSKKEFFRDFNNQEKLAVIMPQEVELYHRLSEKISGIDYFESVDEAVTQLGPRIDQNAAARLVEVQEIVNDRVVAVERLSKKFQDGFQALQNVTAHFDEGQVISILGQNGSGKTTLVKHLNGLLHPTEGKVTYLGKETMGKTVAQISRDIILVFQHPEHMLFEETVLKELTFCARAQNISFNEEEALAVLEKYDLLQDKDELPVNLSMGKKHLLTILSVLFSSARVIILDEPTLGMDLRLRMHLENIIDHLKSQGKTVIMISHEIPFVFKVSDQLLLLSQAKKMGEGTKQELAQQHSIFDDVHITMPPVITLSKRIGLTPVACDVAEFVDMFVKCCKSSTV